MTDTGISNVREAARKGDEDSLREAYRILGRASRWIANGEHEAAVTAIADARYVLRAFRGQTLDEAQAEESNR